MARSVLLTLAVFFMGAPVWGQQGGFLLYKDFDTPLAEATLPPGWSILDADGDGITWEVVDWGGTRGGPAARCLTNPSPNGTADDWLVSTPLPLVPATVTPMASPAGIPPSVTSAADSAGRITRAGVEGGIRQVR